MKGVIVTLVLVVLVIGAIFIKRKKTPILTTGKPMAPTPSKNAAQSLEAAIEKKTGVPLKQIGTVAINAETRLWNQGPTGKVAAVALAPFAAPTAAVQSAIDHPAATAKTAVHALQTGAVAVGGAVKATTKAIIGAPPAAAAAVAKATTTAAKAVIKAPVTAVKDVASGAKSVGKKILSIF